MKSRYARWTTLSNTSEKRGRCWRDVGICWTNSNRCTYYYAWHFFPLAPFKGIGALKTYLIIVTLLVALAQLLQLAQASGVASSVDSAILRRWRSCLLLLCGYRRWNSFTINNVNNY
jgi:hypothetical protein